MPGLYLKRPLCRREQHLPLARYFLYVGGVLLALLLALDAFLPKLPVTDRAYADLPVIRIHSDRKWPERIVFDTSVPTIIPAQMASSEPGTAPPATASDAKSGREAFAQLQPSETKQLHPANLKKREAKPQRRSRIAKRYAPPPFASPQQWQFGWFGQNSWRGG